MRGLAVAFLAVSLIGCGDRGNRVDFGGEEIGPDLYAMHSVDGGVKMALTQDWVYFAISDSIRAEAEAEIEADAEEGGFFSGLLQGAVGRALGFRAKYAVAEIEDIRWEDGRMHFDFTDPDRRLEDNFEFDGQPATEAFAREDVEAFAEAFRAVKRGSRMGEGGSPNVDG